MRDSYFVTILSAALSAMSALSASNAAADSAESNDSIQARSQAQWRFSAEVDLDAFLQEGIAITLGVTPAALPSWRFGLSLSSHDIPDVQMELAGANDNMYASIPIALEASARYRHSTGAVFGARAGMVHVHYARIGTFGIDEEFNYGVTPFLGYEWSPVEHVYVQPWVGAMVTAFSQSHGELPMAAANRTYSEWPAALRGGVSLGARY